MTQTMSNPNDWLHFYHQNFPTQALAPSVSDSTTVPTTTTTTTVAATSISTSSPPMLNSSSPTATHLSPEGRVSKSTRRRSRASRRTPTTLLNTDTTNFRAMVQQFTGGPSAPFAPTASSASGLPNLGFGFASRPVPVNPTALMVAPPGYHLQQHQQQLYQQQNQQYMYSGNTQGGGGDSSFFQRLSNPRPPNVTDHDGFLIDHVHEGRFFPSTSS